MAFTDYRPQLILAIIDLSLSFFSLFFFCASPALVWEMNNCILQTAYQTNMLGINVYIGASVRTFVHLGDSNMFMHKEYFKIFNQYTSHVRNAPSYLFNKGIDFPTNSIAPLG